MAQCRVFGRNVLTITGFTFLLLYLAYFSSELHTRLQNIRKLERLNAYENELVELSRLLQIYKEDAYRVNQGITLLEEIVSKIATQGSDKTRKELREFDIPEKEKLIREADIHHQLQVLEEPLSIRRGAVQEGLKHHANSERLRPNEHEELRVSLGQAQIEDDTNTFLHRKSFKYQSLIKIDSQQKVPLKQPVR